MNLENSTTDPWQETAPKGAGEKSIAQQKYEIKAIDRLFEDGFINQDILAGTLDNSRSLNRYRYVQNTEH